MHRQEGNRQKPMTISRYFLCNKQRPTNKGEGPRNGQRALGQHALKVWAIFGCLSEICKKMRWVPLKRETDTNKMLNTEYYDFDSAVSKLASRTRTQRPSGSLRKIVSV